MKTQNMVLYLLLSFVFLLAACGDSAPNAAEEIMMESPSWFETMLKDVRTGEAFTINDFKGKVILVETMAVWCPTCYRQQQEIKALHDCLACGRIL